MNILGLSDVTGNHSHSCVAVLQDGKLTFALSQERISRVKNDPSFPFAAIDAALAHTGLRLADFDAFACAYPPPRYYASLMQHGVLDLPHSLLGVFAHKPAALLRYLLPNLKKGLFDPKSANGLIDLGVSAQKFRFVDHHLAHVSAGFFSSEFDEALAISYGGFAPHADGRNVAGAVYRCRGNDIVFLQDIPMFASGCCYSGVTVALGFRYMAQEGKTMGLAKTADPGDCDDEVRRLVSRFDDGWRKYPLWIDYILSPRADAFLASVSGRKLLKLIDRYSPARVAAAFQKVWEMNLVNFVKELQKRYSFKNLVLCGGTFLNVQINSLIAGMEGVENIFVHPHPGDGSTAVGAAIEAQRNLTGKPARTPVIDTGLGVEFSDDEIRAALKRIIGKVKIEAVADPAAFAAQRLAAGKIVGWFQGREEYGHRSLGHRCILGAPQPEIKERITRSVKKRESWIPISPSILKERLADFFQDPADPFMMRVCRVRAGKRESIGAALHADGSARVQAVGTDAYPPFRRLIEQFEHLTGMPPVLNTSLNRHGEPMVHTPSEAVDLLLAGAMDVLVIGSFAVQKFAG